jgi:hypothetical protein
MRAKPFTLTALSSLLALAACGGGDSSPAAADTTQAVANGTGSVGTQQPPRTDCPDTLPNTGSNLSSPRVVGTGNVTVEPRALTTFSQVETVGGPKVRVVVTQGDTESLTVQADANLLACIVTKVENGVLTVEPKSVQVNSSLGQIKQNYTLEPTAEILYRLTVKDISRFGTIGDIVVEGADLRFNALTLDAAGSSTVTLPRLQVSTRLALDTAGSATITLPELTADVLGADVAGSATISAAGTVRRQELSSAGSVRYDTCALASKQAQLDMTGGGQATVQVSDTLEASLIAGPTVQYVGNPQVTTDTPQLVQRLDACPAPTP